jgi:hypothetical protein
MNSKVPIISHIFRIILKHLFDIALKKRKNPLLFIEIDELRNYVIILVIAFKLDSKGFF